MEGIHKIVDTATKKEIAQKDKVEHSPPKIQIRRPNPKRYSCEVSFIFVYNSNLRSILFEGFSF